MASPQNKFKAYVFLLRLNRPIGIYLLLWPTLWALWIAGKGPPELKILTIFILGTILMRSAGCLINDYLDRNLDQFVSRTKGRPMATGLVTRKEGLVIFGILITFSALLVLTLNKTTILLSSVGLLLATTYPLAKRLWYLPQFHLGLAFSWGIPMAFSAVTGEVPIVAWSLYLTTIIWTMSYDTFYAMVDQQDDPDAGIKSLALLFGREQSKIITILQIIFLIFLIIIGKKEGFLFPYYLALGLSSLCFIYQHRLITFREPAKYMKAFENNNFVGAIIFVGITMSYHMSLST